MEPMLLRIDEASRLLGLGRSKTYELVSSGVLPSITIGKARRIPSNALRQWVTQQTEQGSPRAGGAKQAEAA